nr:DUF559 domain-containing protein [Microbacterium testaceum]
MGEARDSGVTDRRLRAGDLARPYHGVRAVVLPAGDPASAHRGLVHAYSRRMPPHAFFSHISAAVIWGLPLPARLLADDRIDVSVLTPRRHPVARGVRGHEVLGAGVIVERHPELDLPVSSPASTWAQLGAVVRHSYDLVAIADAAVLTPRHDDDPPALTTIARLERAVAAARRVGGPALRDALPRVRDGSASRPETWLRLTLVDAGPPEPEMQVEVRAGGRLIARLDTAYVAARVAVEYEGRHHLTDARQWRRDIQRYEDLTRMGWIVIRVTSDDLFRHPATLVSRVRSAVASRLA